MSSSLRSCDLVHSVQLPLSGFDADFPRGNKSVDLAPYPEPAHGVREVIREVRILAI